MRFANVGKRTLTITRTQAVKQPEFSRLAYDCLNNNSLTSSQVGQKITLIGGTGSSILTLVPKPLQPIMPVATLDGIFVGIQTAINNANKSRTMDNITKGIVLASNLSSYINGLNSKWVKFDVQVEVARLYDEYTGDTVYFIYTPTLYATSGSFKQCGFRITRLYAADGSYIEE